jgi:hypothetical protein
MSIPKFLSCYICNVNAIPAPEGATEETRYVCAKCSPLGTAEGAFLARCQFDRGHARKPLLSRSGVKQFIATECDRIISIPSPLIEAARDRGEKWVLNASLENLHALPEKSKRCLLLTMWYGMRSEEVAKLLGTRAQTVRTNVFYAKKILANLNGPLNRVRDIRSGKRLHIEKPAT